ncbi:MAG: pyridoxal 5'-phosphate synthase glutaminase subunit PdxT [Spirochaetota bacterium]
MPTVGVLSYQGGFQKHLERLSSIGAAVTAVRNLESLAGVDALVIPGGESTTIGMLMGRFGLLDAVRSRIADGFPVFGTCAGAILLAREIEGSDQPRIGALNAVVRRNAYGRQIESFEADVVLAGPTEGWNGGAFHGVFIRAPWIVSTGPDVTTILAYEERPVLVRQGSLLAATFHPELTSDDRIHRYFIEQVVSP